MNISRGLLRLWLVISLLFVGTVTTLVFNRVKEAFEADAEYRTTAAQRKPPKGYELLIPVDCRLARGTEAVDYEKIIDKEPRDRSLCWYGVSTWRRNYPEYAEVSDEEAVDRAYEKAGVNIGKPPSPWSVALPSVGIALGIPFGTLAIGAAFGWAFAGFRKVG